MTNSVLRRAAVGATAIALRALASQGLAFGTLIILSRALSLRDFGALAVGTGVVTLAMVLSDGGLVAGLIRMREQPSPTNLRAAAGVQLVAMTLLALGAATVVLPFDAVAGVTAVMVAPIPLLALQTPGRVSLERNLQFAKLALVEMVQSVAYCSCACAAALSGLGIWGVAAASGIQVAVGTFAIACVAPASRRRPLLSWREARAVIPFGLKFQAVTMTTVARDQGLNVLVSAFLGLSTLGIWSFASRLLQVPMLIFGALWRVSYPTMARIVREDPQPRKLLESAVGFIAFGAGLVLVPLAGAAPAFIPILFGDRWADAANVVAPASIALMVGAPVSVAAAGFLVAKGRVKDVLFSAIAHTVAWLCAAAALLPLIGVPAIGLGLLAGTTCDALILGRAAKSETGARFSRRLGIPLLASLAGSGAGWTIAVAAPAQTLTVICAVAVSIGIYGTSSVLLLRVFASDVLFDVRTGAVRVCSALGASSDRLARIRPSGATAR